MSALGELVILGSRLFADLAVRVCCPVDISWPADPTYPKRGRLGSDQELRQATEECHVHVRVLMVQQ